MSDEKPFRDTFNVTVASLRDWTNICTAWVTVDDELHYCPRLPEYLAFLLGDVVGSPVCDEHAARMRQWSTLTRLTSYTERDRLRIVVNGLNA